MWPWCFKALETIYSWFKQRWTGSGLLTYNSQTYKRLIINQNAKSLIFVDPVPFPRIRASLSHCHIRAWCRLIFLSILLLSCYFTTYPRVSGTVSPFCLPTPFYELVLGFLPLLKFYCTFFKLPFFFLEDRHTINKRILPMLATNFYHYCIASCCACYN